MGDGAQMEIFEPKKGSKSFNIVPESQRCMNAPDIDF